jgi:dTMP kinase
MSLGSFIVLEGIDGSGTTTQLHQIAEWLTEQGHGVHQTWEPTDNLIGRQIRSLLRGETGPVEPAVLALLFAADRLDHWAVEIQPNLEKGSHVLCDRYVGSSLAYQGLTLDLAWVQQINARAKCPDLTIYLRVSPELALARIQARDGERRELFERRDLLEAISVAYDRQYLVGDTPREDVVVVDGEQAIDTVYAACLDAVRAHLNLATS